MSIELDADEDRKKIDPIIAAFEKFCVAAVNVTYVGLGLGLGYERYVFIVASRRAANGSMCFSCDFCRRGVDPYDTRSHRSWHS